MKDKFHENNTLKDDSNALLGNWASEREKYSNILRLWKEKTVNLRFREKQTSKGKVRYRNFWTHKS